jgi:hypothetical protein
MGPIAGAARVMRSGSQVDLLGYLSNFVGMALLNLVHCLKNQGVLGDRQYENALRSTIEKAGNGAERLDYQFLKVLLEQLGKQHPGGKPPDADAIH